MSAKLYFVPNWNDRYENNRSRLVKELSWVPVPNGHDGESYGRLITRRDAAVVFSAWVLVLQVASRCHPRGTLLRGNGEPHDFESLAYRTRAPAAWFEKAMPVLCELGWLSHKAVPDKELALDWQEGAPASKGSAPEWKGMEGNGTPPPSSDVVGRCERIYNLYPRRQGKKAAMRAISGALRVRNEDQLSEATKAFALATAAWPAGDERFIPMPATWFNQGRYDDDRKTWERTNNGSTSDQRPNARRYSQVDDYSKVRNHGLDPKA